MKIKKIVIFLTALTVVAALTPLVTANFTGPASSHISILSPSGAPIVITDPLKHLQYKHENSTVTLTIAVTLVKEDYSEPPVISYISYSLDGQPLQYLRDFTVTEYPYDTWNQNIIMYTATTTLKNLSEGDHTIQACANNTFTSDSFIGDAMSTSRSFVVDSYYTAPAIKILSPTNQTYSGDVPLVFTVNVDFTKARYFLYEKVDKARAIKNNFASFENDQLVGNLTLEELDNAPNGQYVIAVSATTTKGDLVTALASFNLTKLPMSQIQGEYDTYYFMIMVAIMAAIVGVVLFVCFRNRKKKLTNTQCFHSFLVFVIF